jgi:hypothetical protein
MSPEQEQIATMLGTEAAPLRDIYTAAVRLLADTSFPGRIKFICHAGRDICTSAPLILGIQRSRRADTTTILKAIEEVWREAGLEKIGVSSSLQSPPDPSVLIPDIAIPPNIFRMLQSLIDEYRLGKINRTEQAYGFLRKIAPEVGDQIDALEPQFATWESLREWFQEHAHAGVEIQTWSEEELQSRFSLLEKFLLAVNQTFYEGVGDLDEILAQANS